MWWSFRAHLDSSGLIACHLGDQRRARTLLAQAVRDIPINWAAWAALAAVCDTEDQLEELNLPQHWIKPFFLIEVYSRLHCVHKAVKLVIELLDTEDFEDV